MISCICPTFGRCPERQHLLEDAITCFLLQTHRDKELIVINDCPSQILVCDAPQVRVVNLPHRFRTLGEKYNYAIGLALGEWIAPWEDDDLCLPHRLAFSLSRLQESDSEYYNPKSYWFKNGDLLQHEVNTGYAHCASLFTKAAWRKVEGYPANCSQDAHMDGRLRAKVPTFNEGLGEEKCFYIYRWGVSDHHVSAHGDADGAYLDYGEKKRPAGRFVLRVGELHDSLPLTLQRAQRALAYRQPLPAS